MRPTRSLKHADVQAFRDRFETFFVRGDPDACWEWRGSRHPRGYGDFGVGEKTYRTHRVAYAMYVADLPQKLPDGQFAHGLHKCDNTSCVNPAHLELGPHKKNMEDRKNRGRNGRVPFAVPDDIVRAIRLEMRNRTRTYQAIADQYGLGHTTVYGIAKRITRNDVEDPA